MEYEAVIGLEVHAQVLTKTKIFCGCSTEFGAKPNTHVCMVCLGMPGVLPVLNRDVVDKSIKTSLALDLKINRESIWERKNYFYPDLPKGYQISQFAYPLSEHGVLTIHVSDGAKEIGITRLHMEEDAGKLVHPDAALSSSGSSFVDLNRSGVPLMEIVSEPDMRSPEEAGAYLRSLHDILVYLEVCDGNMEEGSFRCDANISIREKGAAELGTRAELKNMNSFRNVERALEYEIQRQIRVIKDGGKIVQETRLWDDDNGKTRPMRGKEDSHDYRYFPDPDLLPLIVEDEWVEKVKATLPELPLQKRNRFVKEYGIPDSDADVLTSEKALAAYYEQVIEKGADPKKAANWIMAELMRELKNDEVSINECLIKPDQLAAMIKMIDKGEITGKIGKTVIVEMFKSGKDPDTIVEEKGLKPMSDTSELDKLCDEVIENNPKQVEQYKGGKTKIIGFFVGQIMKSTGGKADPAALNQMLKQKLDNK